MSTTTASAGTSVASSSSHSSSDPPSSFRWYQQPRGSPLLQQTDPTFPPPPTAAPPIIDGQGGTGGGDVNGTSTGVCRPPSSRSRHREKPPSRSSLSPLRRESPPTFPPPMTATAGRDDVGVSGNVHRAPSRSRHREGPPSSRSSRSPQQRRESPRLRDGDAAAAVAKEMEAARRMWSSRTSSPAPDKARASPSPGEGGARGDGSASGHGASGSATARDARHGRIRRPSPSSSSAFSRRNRGGNTPSPPLAAATTMTNVNPQEAEGGNRKGKGGIVESAARMTIERAFGPNADLYRDVLKVRRDASGREIRAAYFRRGREVLSVDDDDGDAAGGTIMSRKAAQEDVDARSKTRFQAVSLAYEILSDPELRRTYDESGTMTDVESVASGSAASSSVPSDEGSAAQTSRLDSLVRKADSAASRLNSLIRVKGDPTKRQPSQSKPKNRNSVRWNEEVEELVIVESDRDDKDRDENSLASSTTGESSTVNVGSINSSLAEEQLRRIVAECDDDDDDDDVEEKRPRPSSPLELHLQQVDAEAERKYEKKFGRRDVFDELEASVEELLKLANKLSNDDDENDKNNDTKEDEKASAGCDNDCNDGSVGSGSNKDRPSSSFHKKKKDRSRSNSRPKKKKLVFEAPPDILVRSKLPSQPQRGMTISATVITSDSVSTLTNVSGTGPPLAPPVSRHDGTDNKEGIARDEGGGDFSSEDAMKGHRHQRAAWRGATLERVAEEERSVSTPGGGASFLAEGGLTGNAGSPPPTASAFDRLPGRRRSANPSRPIDATAGATPITPRDDSIDNQTIDSEGPAERAADNRHRRHSVDSSPSSIVGGVDRVANDDNAIARGATTDNNNAEESSSSSATPDNLCVRAAKKLVFSSSGIELGERCAIPGATSPRRPRERSRRRRRRGLNYDDDEPVEFHRSLAAYVVGVVEELRDACSPPSDSASLSPSSCSDDGTPEPASAAAAGADCDNVDGRGEEARSTLTTTPRGTAAVAPSLPWMTSDDRGFFFSFRDDEVNSLLGVLKTEMSRTPRDLDDNGGDAAAVVGGEDDDGDRIVRREDERRHPPPHRDEGGIEEGRASTSTTATQTTDRSGAYDRCSYESDGTNSLLV